MKIYQVIERWSDGYESEETYYGFYSTYKKALARKQFLINHNVSEWNLYIDDYTVDEDINSK